MAGVRTVAARCEAVFTQQRSEFIAQVFPISGAEEFERALADTRAKHHKARHNPWGWRLREGGSERCGDDGEPQGTAGAPILGVLRKSGLEDTGLIVTRYFGGVLLGASGLARAYAQSAALAVQNAKIQTLYEALLLRVCVDYAAYGAVKRLLERVGAKERDSEFAQNVTLTFDIRQEDVETLFTRLTEMGIREESCEKLKTHLAAFD